MEEIKEESCSTKAKKCCTKGIVIVLICSLISFFLGYYFGSKSNGKIQRAASSGISRPFSPNIPRLPNRTPNIPKIPKIQRPPIQRINQPNISKPPVSKPNIPQNIQKEESQTATQTKSTTGNKPKAKK